MIVIAWIAGILGFFWLLFRFPRQTVLLVAVLAVLVGTGLWIYFTGTGADEAREREQVTATAVVGDARCDPAHPVLVTFHNGAARTLDHVSFMLEGRRPQHSQTVYSNFRSSDRILAPGESYGACWAPDSYGVGSADITELDWSARILAIAFRD